MSRIFLFSRDPGGARALIPLLEPLAAQGFEALLYGKDFALGCYQQAGFSGLELPPDVSPGELASFMGRLAPDCIVTGTSADDFTEKWLWRAASQFNIPSIAILDQWMNYGVRFSSGGLSDAVHDRDYTPDRIALMDAFARAEMLALGFEPQTLVVTGQPYFQWIHERSRTWTPQDVQTLRNQLGIPLDARALTFASQPLETLYEGRSPYGYSEVTTLTAILTALQTLLDDPQMPPICLIVKLHPREAPDRLASVIRAWSHPKLRIMLNRETDPDEMIAVSDVVIGMFSMLLIEAFMACKPIVSAQLNLTGDDPFVLSRRGYVCAITSQEALLAELRGLLLNPPASLPALDWIQTPTQNVIHLIQSLTTNG